MNYNLLFTSPLLGITYLGLLFLFSLVLVVGIKTVYYAIKAKPEPRKKQVKKKPVPLSKPIKSIEINPDEVDKIYVKKY